MRRFLGLFNGKSMGEPIIVVSGLPRSGTSMLMKMLKAGGLELFEDGQRQADEDNPRGYFELEKVKTLDKQTDKAWLKEVRGKAIKVISQLLPQLPPENRYQVLFINRHLDEVLASQDKMLVRRGKEVEPGSHERMRDLFEKHLRTTKSWLAANNNFQVLELDYAQVISDPVPQASRIRSFLDRGLDVGRMASVVEEALYRNRATTTSPPSV